MIPGWALPVLLILEAIIFLLLFKFLIRRKYIRPLLVFREMLEDVAEGFIPEDSAKPLSKHADADLADAFSKVIAINRAMLRNVDHLEKGFEEERRAKLKQIQLTEAYERFVPHQFLDNLQKNSILDIRLGDHVQTAMTVLFSDIRGFTAMSERMTPAETFRFLGAYLAHMEPIVRSNNGFIDKFIGDSVMALFRSPDDAVNAGLSMLQSLKLFNQERAKLGEPSIDIGIGVNTGVLMLGVVGGTQRMESTVISDAVNLASRIESLNKVLGTRLLISEFTHAALLRADQFQLKPLGDTIVTGKSQAVRLYEVTSSIPAAQGGNNR